MNGLLIAQVYLIVFIALTLVISFVWKAIVVKHKDYNESWSTKAFILIIFWPCTLIIMVITRIYHLWSDLGNWVWNEYIKRDNDGTK